MTARALAAALWHTLLALLAACAPVDAPPQLAHTPGAPFVVSGDTFRGAAFSVRFPHGWRVITGEAQRPPRVIFAAPGDDRLILVAVGAGVARPPQPPAAPPARGSVTRVLTIGGQAVTVYGVAPAADWAAFMAAFEDVAASLSAPLADG